MSRLIHFLARLYPRSWRERYGAEYAALLEDVRPNGRTAANVLTGAIAMQIRTWKSRGILAASVFFGAAVISGLFVAMPNSYVSKAVLKVGSQAGGHEAIDAINALAISVESRSGLAQVITTYGLYQRERSRMPLEDVLQEMRKHIRITPVDSNAAIAIEFDYSDPHMAQKVTQDLVTRFIDENFQEAVRKPSGVNLQVLDAASLPQSPIYPNKPLIIGVGIAGFLLMWGALSLMRRASIRRHERAGSGEVHPRTWTDWRILTASALASVAVIVGGFFAIPKVYSSAAVIRVRGQSDPQQTIDTINTIARNVEGRAKLTEIITVYGLYQNERSKMTLEQVIQQMLKRITVTPMGANPAAIRIGFDYNDRHVAQRVTADLASRFLNESQHSQGVSLQMLDLASIPEYPIQPTNLTLIGLGLACFLLMWGALSAWRGFSVRRHAQTV